MIFTTVLVCDLLSDMIIFGVEIIPLCSPGNMCVPFILFCLYFGCQDPACMDHYLEVFSQKFSHSPTKLRSGSGMDKESGNPRSFHLFV